MAGQHQLCQTVVQRWIYLCVSLVIITKALGSGQEFITQPENATAIQNSTVILRCEVKNRKGVLQWTRSRLGLGTNRNLPGFPRYSMVGGSSYVGTDLIEEYSLKIVDVTLEDDADYRCQVTATEATPGIISKKVSLTVQLPPERPQMGDTSTIAVIQGVATNISCQANNGKPGAVITWYKDGIRVTDNTFSRTKSKPNKLADTVSVITMVATKEDAGKKIECKATNPALRNPYVTHAILDVQYPPKLTMSNNISRTLRERDSVRFTCTGTANPYNIRWRWYLNGEEIEGEYDNIYDIKSLSRDNHKDEISCEGANAVGSTRAHMTLDVEFGPQFIGPPKHVAVDLGDEATLSCIADGNPMPSIIWTKEGYNKAVSTSSTYHIDTVEYADLGTYICTATSLVGFHDVSRQIHLLQNGPPKILSSKHQYAASGASAKLECLVRSVPPPLEIKWMRDNKEITYADSGRYSELQEILDDGVKHMLQILTVQEQDFGEYNCSVTNKRGTDLLTITLSEKDILPLSYIIGGVVGGVGLIFLIIIIFVIYNRYKSSDTDSYAETDSNTEIKKREKSDSPDFTKSTLMDQWRQDLNYHCPTDYDDIYGQKDHKLNSSGYGTLTSDNYINAYENHNGGPLFSDYTHRTDETLPSETYHSWYSLYPTWHYPRHYPRHFPRETPHQYHQDYSMYTLRHSPRDYGGASVYGSRFENVNGYNTYGTSTFRSASRTDFNNPDYTDPYRLPPADVNTAKLATTV